MHRCSQRALPRAMGMCVLSVFLSAPSIPGQEAANTYRGRSLTDALRVLQARGLPVVFSSETVTADMRVVGEPRATSLRQILDELLAPHGLKAEKGPGRLIIVVRAKRAESRAGHTAQADRSAIAFGREAPGGPAGTYHETVTVRPSWRERAADETVSDVRLGPGELQDLRGILADDPIRGAQALPGVAAADDFRSEFSMRGSPFRQIGVVVDGVATPWLLHSANGRGDSASTAMFSSDVIAEASLQAGAFPRRDGNRLGAQLGVVLREGSRVTNGFRAAISGTGASFLADGPIGGSHRGSWLVNARQSYRDWPIRRPSDQTVFGFHDVLAKAVYDVRPRQQISMTLLSGDSALDRMDAAPATLGEGANRTTVLTVAWRSAPVAGMVISQRAYVVAHRFLDKDQDGRPADRGQDGELAYRVDATRTMFGGILETGAQTARLSASRYASPATTDQPLPLTTGRFDGAAWLHSGHVNVTWHPASQLTLAHGFRVSDSTLVHHRALDDWIIGEWSLQPGWTLNAAAGLSHQFPEFQQVFGSAGAPGLRPERATHLDLGLERRVARSVRWKMTFYERQERDVLREPDRQPRLVDDVLIEPSAASRYDNALTGASRGVELLLERRAAVGVSGWVAYSYGKTRFEDRQRKETFWGDFDQRHSVNIFAVYRRSESTSLGATFRGGSNFPVPGYLRSKDGGLVAGALRNDVRLAQYARLDLRANRVFTNHGHRLTVFVEVLNVLNRTNLGAGTGRINSSTGAATGFTRPLFPRIPSAGLIVAF